MALDILWRVVIFVANPDDIDDVNDKLLRQRIIRILHICLFFSEYHLVITDGLIIGFW